MTGLILCFANDQNDKVGRFLNHLSRYNHTHYFGDEFHHFENYIKIGLECVAGIMIDGQLQFPGKLRPGYDYKGKDEYLRKTIPWYKIFAEECNSNIMLPLTGSANTERAQKYFRKAIEKGWIVQKKEGKYEWCAFKTPKRGANDTAWAYFIAKVYEFDYKGGEITTNQLPRKYLEDLFSMPSGTLGAAFARIKASKNMKWQIEIDLFFKE